MENAARQSFLVRNEFLIRRLHSLSGLIPVGAYMVVHLMTNASIQNGPAAFQKNVYTIHSLGAALPLVEWGFIFLPLLFHAIIGVVIIQGGIPNTSSYPTRGNIRYTLQRVTGMIAFFFIMWHVFHMHGWFHNEQWLAWIQPLKGAQFVPYRAASSAAAALQSYVVLTLYAIGVLSCVYHLANGIWTMGITWGAWVTPAAQRRASWVCLVFGVLLGAVGMGALSGFKNTDVQKAAAEEDKMWDARVESGEIDPNLERNAHKRGPAHSHSDAPSAEAEAEEADSEAAEDDSASYNRIDGSYAVDASTGLNLEIAASTC